MRSHLLGGLHVVLHPLNSQQDLVVPEEAVAGAKHAVLLDNGQAGAARLCPQHPLVLQDLVQGDALARVKV